MVKKQKAKRLRTFVDFSLFLSIPPLLNPVGTKLRTPQNSSELFLSTCPSWNTKVLRFWDFGAHRERYIKSNSNIKKERRKESNIKKKREKEKRNKAFRNFLFDSKFLNAICLMVVAMLAARLGGLT